MDRNQGVFNEAEWQKSPYKQTQQKEQLANTNSSQVVGKRYTANEDTRLTFVQNTGLKILNI